MSGPGPLGPHDGLDFCVAISVQRHARDRHQQYRDGRVNRVSLAKAYYLSLGCKVAGRSDYGGRHAGTVQKDPGHCAPDARALDRYVTYRRMGHRHGNDSPQSQAAVRFSAGGLADWVAIYAWIGQW